MGQIKSAWERAMEKVERLGEATEAERLQWKYVPEGESLATGLLKDERNLLAELARYEEPGRRYVIQGAQQVILKNIDLPKNDFLKKNTRKAMEALKALKKDKAAVENVYSKMRRIFSHYEQEGDQQRRQVVEALKQDFQAKLAQMMKQQGGPAARYNMNVETHPQFQEERRRTLAQLDSSYYRLLEEYKRDLLDIS